MNEEIRKQLQSDQFLDYEKAESIKKQLHDNSIKKYTPKYPDEYMKFMNDNECSFTQSHPQSKNEPYYFTMFSCASQHVMGDCVEECLDKAIDESIKNDRWCL